MGKPGPRPGTMLARPRDKAGRYVPVTIPIKTVPTEQVVAAIEKNFGLQTLVAKEVGLHLRTILTYAAELEAVREAFWGQGERVLDMAELALYGAVQKGEAWAVCFLLKTRGKNRGYIERQEVSQEITGKGGGPIDARILHIEIPPAVLTEALATLFRAGALEVANPSPSGGNGQNP